MKIAVIQHENDFEGESNTYFIEMIARCWREAGHQVIFVNGIQKKIRADLAILHVNLSVVPQEYVEYANQFPVVLNNEITDIRKRKISQQLISRNDDYNGPVIVKTDLNCGGIPEAKIYNRPIPKWRSPASYWRQLVRKTRNVFIKIKLLDNTADRIVQTEYRESFKIFKDKNFVPNYIWRDEDWVTEKFLPEKEGSEYVTNNAYFLGNIAIGFKNISGDPIVKDVEGKGDIIKVPDVIRRYRDQIGLDYGKIDYVIRNGTPVILDITKTVGGAFAPKVAEMLAPGLENYLVGKKEHA